MSYSYAEHLGWLATADGARAVGRVIRRVETVLDAAGAADMTHLMSANSGDSWQMMAAVDHCVAMGLIVEVHEPGLVAGQDRLFVRVRR